MLVHAEFRYLARVELDGISIGAGHNEDVPRQCLLHRVGFAPHQARFFVVLLRLDQHSRFVGRGIAALCLGHVYTVQRIELGPCPLQPQSSAGQRVDLFAILVRARDDQHLFALLVSEANVVVHNGLVPLGRVAQFLDVFDVLQRKWGITIGGVLDGPFQLGVFLPLNLFDSSGLHAVLLKLGERFTRLDCFGLLGVAQLNQASARLLN
ncbi:hypothetical protein D3C76_1290640 [compost metagenome]